MILQLLTIIIVGFYLGVFVSYIKVTNIKIKTADSNPRLQLRGTVDSMHPIAKGFQVILKNIQLFDYLDLGIDAKIILNMEDKNPQYTINDKILLAASLFPPQQKSLPYGYDYAFTLLLDKVAAIGSNNSAAFVVEQEPINTYSYIQNLRILIYQKLKKLFSPETIDFVAALLIGESKAINKKIMTDIRYAGISHILCVSGLHISLIAAMFFKSFRFIFNISDFIALRFDIKILAGIASFIATIIYWLLTDIQIAATRAFIMNSIVILALLKGRKVDILRSLNLACFLLLVIHPEYAMKASFQLSFLAVLSLILAGEIYNYLKSYILNQHNIRVKIKLYFYNTICFSLLVNFATGPVCIYNFFIFSNYSLITNLIAVPLTLFFIIPLIIITIILVPLPFAQSYTIYLIEIAIVYIIKLADFVVNLKGSITYFGYITSFSLLIYLLGFFWLCIWKKRWRFFGIVIMLFSFFMMLTSPKPVVIFNPNEYIIAAQNNKNELEIFTLYISDFQKRYWNDWFGQKDIMLNTMHPGHKNWFFNFQGKKVAILFNDDYEKNDDMLELVINNMKEPHLLNSKKTLSYEEIKNSTNNILVYCNKNECFAQY